MYGIFKREKFLSHKPIFGLQLLPELGEVPSYSGYFFLSNTAMGRPTCHL